MSDNRFDATLKNAQSLRAEFERAWKWAQQQIADGNALSMELVHAKTREQEKLYHSCFRDLARDCLLGGGKQDDEAWKRSLLYAFYLATKEDPEFAADWKGRAPRLVPALDDGGMVMVPIESKRFTKKLAGGFITFVHATGDLRGVRWSRTSLGREVPDEFFASPAPARRAAQRQPEEATAC